MDGFGDTVSPKILIYAKTDKQKLFYYYIDTRLVLIPAIPTFDNKNISNMEKYNKGRGFAITCYDFFKFFSNQIDLFL